MMHWIYRIAVLYTLSLYGEANYLICIEGGGSKTILQVMNQVSSSL